MLYYKNLRKERAFSAKIQTRLLCTACMLCVSKIYTYIAAKK